MSCGTTVNTPTILGDSSSERAMPRSSPVARQTQATIGLVTLAGSALSFLVDPLWVLVPAVIGVALLVAGASGICPLALLISRMPWNRRSGSSAPDAGASCGTGGCGCGY